MQSIVAIATCHNRAILTVRAVNSLFASFSLLHDYSLDLIIVDDGSTDGTAELLNKKFKNITILYGDGDLYWNQGMRYGLSTAICLDFDYYLLFNDDVLFDRDMFSVMFSTLDNFSGDMLSPNLPSIAVGAVLDDDGDFVSYGGLVSSSIWHPLRFKRAEISDLPVYCDTLNMNCALLTREVVRRVGNLNEAFQHRWGDMDYGLRARKEGCSIILSDKYIGKCKSNTVRLPFFETKSTDNSLISSFYRFIGFMYEKPSERLVIYRNHGGFFWLLFFIIPYILFVPRWVFSRLKQLYFG